MRSLLLTLTAAACVVAIARTAAADPPTRNERPNPEKWFDVLDKDHDGQLTLDDLPPFLKSHTELLKQADKNQDRKFSKDEFAKALGQMKDAVERHWREGHRGPRAARAGEARPMDARRAPDDKPPAERVQHAAHSKRPDDKQTHAKRPEGKPHAGRGDVGDRRPPWSYGVPHGDWRAPDFAGHRAGPAWAGGRCPCSGCSEHARQFRPYGRPEPFAGHREGQASPHGPRPQMPPQAMRGVFARMDRNRDGVLSFEEFAHGMAFLHQRMAAGKHPHRPFHPGWQSPAGPGRPLPPGHPSMMRAGPAASRDGDRHHHRGSAEARRPHGPPPQCSLGCPGCPNHKPASKGGDGNPPPHHEKKHPEKKDLEKRNPVKSAEK